MTGVESVLVDTSAWIVSFRKSGHSKLKEFLSRCIHAGCVSLCPVIMLELLQGCRSAEEKTSLRKKLESLDMYSMSDQVWERSYELAFTLRRKGVVVPLADLIIASVALEQKALVLHQDHHYEIIAQHAPLRVQCFDS